MMAVYYHKDPMNFYLKKRLVTGTVVFYLLEQKES